jgi:hypothetical protein
MMNASYKKIQKKSLYIKLKINDNDKSKDKKKHILWGADLGWSEYIGECLPDV